MLSDIVLCNNNVRVQHQYSSDKTITHLLHITKELQIINVNLLTNNINTTQNIVFVT